VTGGGGTVSTAGGRRAASEEQPRGKVASEAQHGEAKSGRCEG
jgi:hypothetical protein